MKKYRSQVAVVLFALLFSSASVWGQKAKTEEERKYLEVLHNRSEKILDDYVDLPQGEIREEVRGLMVRQYWNLNKMHDETEAVLKEAKERMDKSAYETFKERKENKADKVLGKLQKRYLRQLGKHLSQQQIDGIKDGMTLGALAHNYNGYLAMIPSLTEEEKAYIYAQFVEARDEAMVLGSSKDKLAVFRQYKGRINNWLSAERGYDLEKEGAAWQERLKKAQQP